MFCHKETQSRDSHRDQKIVGTQEACLPRGRCVTGPTAGATPVLWAHGPASWAPFHPPGSHTPIWRRKGWTQISTLPTNPISLRRA